MCHQKTCNYENTKCCQCLTINILSCKYNHQAAAHGRAGINCTEKGLADIEFFDNMWYIERQKKGLPKSEKKVSKIPKSRILLLSRKNVLKSSLLHYFPGEVEFNVSEVLH
jgi:hypothetical protein